MKFLKLLGRETLYYLFSLSLSFFLDPESAPSCSCIGFKKVFATLNSLFETSVFKEHCIFAKQLLIQLLIWGRQICPAWVVEMLWNTLFMNCALVLTLAGLSQRENHIAGV